MDKETYIITDHELYRKVDWNAYELYFLQSAKEKIRTDISPNIINATKAQYKNLIYKDPNVIVFGKIDPTI